MLIFVNQGVDLHFVFEDIQITELAEFGELAGQARAVSLVVLVGEDRHLAVPTVVSPPTLGVPLRCRVAAEVSQPGGPGAELQQGAKDKNY